MSPNPRENGVTLQHECAFKVKIDKLQSNSLKGLFSQINPNLPHRMRLGY